MELNNYVPLPLRQHSLLSLFSNYGELTNPTQIRLPFCPLIFQNIITAHRVYLLTLQPPVYGASQIPAKLLVALTAPLAMASTHVLVLASFSFISDKLLPN